MKENLITKDLVEYLKPWFITCYCVGALEQWHPKDNETITEFRTRCVKEALEWFDRFEGNLPPKTQIP